MATIEEQFKLNKGITKPFKTIDEQLDLLISRGLIVNDRDNALNILSRTNYYRFSAYSLTLRQDDHFYEGVTFDNIYELYRFDDCIRKIIYTYSQYVEISMRSFIAYEHAKKYGPLGYMESSNFESPFYFADFINKLAVEIDKSDDVFVYHYKKDKNSVFPIWVAIECCTFGNLSKMFKNMKTSDRTEISKNHFGVHREYIENWLQAAVFARNIAAHGGRLYNRKMRSVPVKLGNKQKTIIDPMSPFAYIYIIHKMQPTKALARKMRKELGDALDKYQFARKEHLGFPDNWLMLLEETENPKAF